MQTTEQVSIVARLVVRGGGTVGTARPLLGSGPHLPALSPQVGRNIAFNGSVKVVGLLGDHLPDGDMFADRSHPGMVSYQFLESRGVTLTAVKALPLQAMTAGRVTLGGEPWRGERHLALLQKLRHRMLVITSSGLTPPAGEIRLGPTGLRELYCPDDGRLLRYQRETRTLINSIFVRNDADPVLVLAGV